MFLLFIDMEIYGWATCKTRVKILHMPGGREKWVDWSSVATEERKLLYRACRTVMDRTGQNMNQLFKDALGFQPSSSDSYEDNFRSGRISRKHAARIHDWLHRIHPDDARRLDAEITGLYVPDGYRSPWEAFVEEFGEFEQLDVEVIAIPEIERVSGKIRPGWTPEPTSIFANEMFCFRFASPFDGYVVAFQWLNDQWHTFSLAHSGLGERLTQGPQVLPRRDGNHRPGLPMTKGYREDSEFGLHRLVFLLLPFPLAAEICGKLYNNYRVPEGLLNTFAQKIAREPRAHWRVWRCDLIFASNPPAFSSRKDESQHKSLTRRGR